MQRLLTALAFLCLASCAGKDNRQPLDFQAINAVEAEIKRQIGIYMLATAKLPKTIVNAKNERVLLSDDENDFQCGGGHISFDILSVKADLLATTETTFSGGGGITVPFSAGSGGFTGDHGKTTSNTQQLVYNLWFDPISDHINRPGFRDQPIDEPMVADTPIAFAIINLRNALIASGLKKDPYTGETRGFQPCHWDWDQSKTKPGGDPGDTMKFAVEVVKDTKVGGKLNIYLVNLDLSGEWKSTTGNTITVSFYQTGTLDATADKPIKRRASKPVASYEPFDYAQAGVIRVAAVEVAQAPEALALPRECVDVCRPPNEQSRSCIRCQKIGASRPMDFGPDRDTSDDTPPPRPRSPISRAPR